MNHDYAYNHWVIAGILGFFAVRMAIGYWAASKVNNASDYIVAGRGLPIYMTSASIMATWFAAETLMGASANAYLQGFQGVIYDPFGAVLCLLVSGFFFIRLMRRARYLTVVDFFEKRFGRATSALGSFVQILAYLVWTAAQFVAGGVVARPDSSRPRLRISRASMRCARVTSAAAWASPARMASRMS